MAAAPLKPQILVFTRPESDGGTVAIVKLTPLDGPFNPDLFTRLVQGVTRWVSSSDEGREAYEESSEDLNIGDLADYEAAPALVTALEGAGIGEFHVIEMFDGNEVHAFDTLLFDPSFDAPGTH
jgi:hypothetical protein